MRRLPLGKLSSIDYFQRGAEGGGGIEPSISQLDILGSPKTQFIMGRHRIDLRMDFSKGKGNQHEEKEAIMMKETNISEANVEDGSLQKEHFTRFEAFQSHRAWMIHNLAGQTVNPPIECNRSKALDRKNRPPPLPRNVRFNDCWEGNSPIPHMALAQQAVPKLQTLTLISF